jgi:hypothetical protein
MPRLPLFKLGSSAETAEPPKLTKQTPVLTLKGLQLGVDNLRHDVQLSFKFVEQIRLHLIRLIAQNGNISGMLSAEEPDKTANNHFIAPAVAAKAKAKAEPTDLKPLLAGIHLAALNRAKADSNPEIDLLARVAILKFLRLELNAQFGLLLERCRMMLKSFDGVRAQKAMEYRDRVGGFQIAKKTILRKAGQELFRTLREIEKETLARTRRSLFGTVHEEEYRLFLNPLVFTEDGREPYLNAEHYVMLGNFERDADRFENVRRVLCLFLQTLNLGPDAEVDATLDSWMNVPENAQELVASGSPDENTKEGRAQKARLQDWMQALEQERIMDQVVASYEVVPLLAEYSPRINAQQLKNALISREERERVEKLISEGKLSPENLNAAVARASNCRGADRAKVAGRFMRDFLRYHRDFRRLEATVSAFDSVNLMSSDKMRELSTLNGTLYEFLLPEEQKPTEDKVVRHVILKADVRDSSRLTRSLMERSMNPASYFSLNFYDPVNKLLGKYGATKVFVEGDALILALLEREGEAALAVSKTCVLAREIIDIVQGYNQLLQRSGLPPLELGVGISFQDSSPMYLVDAGQRIMISDALNESDRLSSCNKRIRKTIEALESPFNVYAFQTVSDSEGVENSDDFILKYNLNGIRLSEEGFRTLKEEISLEPCQLDLPELWGDEGFKLWCGMVPVGNDIFRKVVIRGSRIPLIDMSNFGLKQWSDRLYYEVCSNPVIYNLLEESAAAGK